MKYTKVKFLHSNPIPLKNTLTTLVHSPFPRCKTFLEGIFLSSVVAAILMESMSEKWIPFRTNLILGKRKKSHRARSREYGDVRKFQCFFWRETDEYSRLCEQERYRDGASMRELFKGSSSCYALILRGAKESLYR